MFGSNAAGSSWGNPQQNQQQPSQQPFGRQNGFGTGGFGTGAFGQPQQQPQPQANPMFGGLTAAPASNTTAPAFGAFGSNTAQTTSPNPLFGGSKPTTGFGAFGANTTPAFGGGGTFGQPANNSANTSGTGGVFGQPAAPTGAFGSTSTSLFGKPNTGFGTTQTNAQSGGYDGVAPVSTGSSNPPYTVFSEKDASNTNSSVMLQYQAISCMPAYRGSSFEELRLQDYAQGRKTAGSFGQSAAFGVTAPTTSTTGIFGAPAQQTQPTTSLFGNNNNQTAPAFGFGQTAAPATTTANAFGAFGQPQQQPASTGFGAFGQNTQTQQQPQQSTGLFGAPKPAAGAFGSTGAFGTNTFGQPAQQQQQQQQQQQPGTGIFGTQPAAQSNLFGGAFGANNTNNAAKPSLFGPQPATQPTLGLFGNAQQPAQQGQPTQPQQPSGGLFGGSLFGNQQQNQQAPQANQQPQGGLFGNNAQPAQTGSLFGNTPSLFGSNQQQQPNQQQGAQTGGFGIFNKPAAPATQPNLFGNFGTNTNNANTQPSSLFGSSLGQSNQQQPNTGTGAFGNSLFSKTTAPLSVPSQSTNGLGGGALFTNSLGQTGMFNATASNSGAQGSLTASISQPIGADLPIFSMLPPGPRAITMEQPSKKKAGFFVDIPTRSPVPRLQLGYAPKSTQLRGFTSSSSSQSLNASSGLSFSFNKANPLTMSTSMGPDAFLGRSASPALGSGSRQSVKKLVLDKKVEPSDLFKAGGNPGSSRGKITFNPALSMAAREKESSETTTSSFTRQSESPAPAPKAGRQLNRFTAQSTNQVIDSEKGGAPKERGTAALEEGDYWVKPDLETLRHAGYEELSAFKGLVVGRIGYGEIHFLEPVDLTGLPKLGALLGTVVRFDDKECSVYPDSDDADKPSPGSGLNVRAKIILVRCWATDKATREPIKDEKHPAAVKHLKRLKNMKDTHFESFTIADGEWTFTVDHF